MEVETMVRAVLGLERRLVIFRNESGEDGGEDGDEDESEEDNSDEVDGDSSDINA